MKNKEETKVEIARSFSYRLNVGNYEHRDFFCSQKAEVPESEAEETAKKLFNFCIKQVMNSVALYLDKYVPKPIKQKDALKANEEFEELMKQDKIEEIKDEQNKEDAQRS